jgi:tRNA-dihydrouridine synthase C
MLSPDNPAVVFAPMDGVTDAAMRSLQGESGAWTYAVSEFVRVSCHVLPPKVFLHDVPEIRSGGRTRTGLPVQVQLLGGDPELMAQSAAVACRAGATGIDINFGCPAPTVNRHDGGATLLNHPSRIRAIVAAVRAAVPSSIPVSAKLRLGWDCVRDIHANAASAAEGGASWLTIHARTRMQGYAPPVHWKPIGEVRRALGIPVVANGDIWTVADFRRCQEETGCIHFMLGRGALANPPLAAQVASELGLASRLRPVDTEWIPLLEGLVRHSKLCYGTRPEMKTLVRLKQWLNIARKHGEFAFFDLVKRAASEEELFAALRSVSQPLALR